VVALSDAGFSIVAVVDKLEFPNRGNEGQYKKIRVEGKASGPDEPKGAIKCEGWRTVSTDDDTEHPWVAIIERAAKSKEPIVLKGWTEPYDYNITRGPRAGQKGQGTRYNLNNAAEWDGSWPDQQQVPLQEPPQAATAPQSNGQGAPAPNSPNGSGGSYPAPAAVLAAGLAFHSGGPAFWMDETEMAEAVKAGWTESAWRKDFLARRAAKIIELARTL
jgi:hypothetical protein